MSSTQSGVEVGQVWIDNDWRTHGRRRVEVVEIGSTHARVKVLTDYTGGKPIGAKFTSIRLDRFKPNSTGYRLEVSRG